MKNKKIGVIGLGYVGLPLAIEFSENNFNVVGYDINSERIKDLKNGIDTTSEIDEQRLKATDLVFTSDEKELLQLDIFIITVPTPIDTFKQPDLSHLISASALVGKYLKKGALVIYESTVYPGCTEEECVPVLEKISGLKFNMDFYCGYSPERINPGDKKRKVHNIVKVTSGSTEVIATVVDELYKTIVKVGTHKASSIKVAEASKIIENIQRDLNISLINELALIFDRLSIDTLEVLEAAGSKWNFLPFRPGLVGGHCIGVDPYYLTHKAESLGYHPSVILSGRRVNDNMGKFIAHKVIKLMVKNDIKVKGSKILVLGITFKENCSDIRNSRIIDLVTELEDFEALVDVYDPKANKKEVKAVYNISLLEKPTIRYDGIILAVSHTEFLNIDLTTLKNNATSVVYDIKSILPREQVTDRL
ncbi:nucleotide sugar dehydrogenase [Maribacter antarcticus]|uniref:nucleotide sugar dehydrogenase n=1 Tax=Maribacter antarcticus TaxID=505250 RepID=UPI00047E3964|nr:nucleotide sugar dehydrogenase [Maribacter antarcticus]